MTPISSFEYLKNLENNCKSSYRKLCKIYDEAYYIMSYRYKEKYEEIIKKIQKEVFNEFNNINIMLRYYKLPLLRYSNYGRGLFLYYLPKDFDFDPTINTQSRVYYTKNMVTNIIHKTQIIHSKRRDLGLK